VLGPYVPLSLVVHFMSRDSMCRYLKFGCVSVRKMFRELQRLLACSPKHTLPPVSLVGQLYWREYFYLASVTTANYDKMAGNSICRQIPWARDAQVIKAWEEGRTGYPWSVMRCLLFVCPAPSPAVGSHGFPRRIDAIMTQLKQVRCFYFSTPLVFYTRLQWGWIHHLARHSVACFLTRGDLWQTWEAGAEVAAASAERYALRVCDRPAGI
jgi:cryptochrome